MRKLEPVYNKRNRKIIKYERIVGIKSVELRMNVGNFKLLKLHRFYQYMS